MRSCNLIKLLSLTFSVGITLSQGNSISFKDKFHSFTHFPKFNHYVDCVTAQNHETSVIVKQIQEDNDLAKKINYHTLNRNTLSDISFTFKKCDFVLESQKVKNAVENRN